MIESICQPRNLLRLSSLVLSVGLALLLVGIVLAYGFDRHLSIVELVGAHALTIIGPTLLKIGYVMRLIAAYRLSQDETSAFAHVAF
ncbi:transmembrane sensor/regulator PpyR [Aquipseudomonas ullengensis]|uniref:Transmembrane sensor/regulator PpyR n=1 Tax=Aquipseudomonas ullengensis TaxID=2759166 RepID=A0A7W4QAN6_9GAMM|nr:transmembrane sensor/regulator PpyR [Pseudomonas ullengensis]MBB2496037.1 transmembrane sensor/regulator PpyR [Pseudomonas ullengensis]